MTVDKSLEGMKYNVNLEPTSILISITGECGMP